MTLDERDIKPAAEKRCGKLPWAVLAAALLEDELAAQPESTPDEQKIPPYVRGVCAE